MKIHSFFLFAFLFFGSFSKAQDTVKVRKPDDDRFCYLMLCVKSNCQSDSISKALISPDNKIELRINDKCNAKKKTDVFVRSFEVWTKDNGVLKSESAESSFLTDRQVKLIRSLKKGDSFEIKSVMVHGPDGFRKMDNLRIILK